MTCSPNILFRFQLSFRVLDIILHSGNFLSSQIIHAVSTKRSRSCSSLWSIISQPSVLRKMLPTDTTFGHVLEHEPTLKLCFVGRISLQALHSNILILLRTLICYNAFQSYCLICLLELSSFPSFLLCSISTQYALLSVKWLVLVPIQISLFEPWLAKGMRLSFECIWFMWEKHWICE